MIKHFVLAGVMLIAAAGCNKRETPPTPAERKAAESAQVEKSKDEIAKQKADHAVDVAKQEQKVAGKTLDAVKEKAEDTADKVNLDWKGPDTSFDKSWTKFADGHERTVDSGDYVIERDKTGAVVAWRKTQQVTGDAFKDLRDAALVTQVKAKLAADEDVRARNINVDAENHTVRLSGMVRSSAEAAKAVRLALATPGTERVISNLTYNKVR